MTNVNFNSAKVQAMKNAHVHGAALLILIRDKFNQCRFMAGQILKQAKK